MLRLRACTSSSPKKARREAEEVEEFLPHDPFPTLQLSDASTSSDRITMYESPSSSNSDPEYLGYITVSPTSKLALTFSPSSSVHPLPTATTVPMSGLSCAESGSRTPPTLESSDFSTYMDIGIDIGMDVYG